MGRAKAHGRGAPVAIADRDDPAGSALNLTQGRRPTRSRTRTGLRDRPVPSNEPSPLMPARLTVKDTARCQLLIRPTHIPSLGQASDLLLSGPPGGGWLTPVATLYLTELALGQ